jgi:hypothetical protein
MDLVVGIPFRRKVAENNENIRFFITFIFYHRAVVIEDHSITHWLSYANPGS